MGRMRSVRLVLAVLGLVLTSTEGQSSRRRNRNNTPAPTPDTSDFDGVLFLEKTGYLDNLPASGHSERSIYNAISEFQRFTGLPQSGRLDEVTMQKMVSPRCGVADVIRPSERPQSLTGGDPTDPATPLAFNAPGYKWNTPEVTYKFTSYTRQLGGQQQIDAVRNAFRKWEDVTNLRFRKMDRGTVQMDIGFGRGEHGDGAGNAFDGRGRTLAHAFFPGQAAISGDTHFDDDEQWTLGTTQGTNLEIVAAHEFGHALGLGHSSEPTALMAPYYQGYDPNWTLKEDDIRGIQSLYGARQSGGRPTQRPQTTTRPTRTTRRTTTRRTTTRRPNRTTTPSPTSNCGMRFDAIEQVHDGTIYAFRRRYIYRVGRNNVYDKREIADVFPGCPGGVGGVVYDRYRRKLFVFKGRRYYRFTGYTMDPGYPKRLPNDFFWVRAAMQWVNGAIYVFKDRDKYAHWSESLTGYSRGFPQTRRSKWEGMPINMDAAFRKNDGYFYIFKGSRYWRYNSRAELAPGFPKASGPDWLNCHESQNQRQGNRNRGNRNRGNRNRGNRRSRRQR